MTTVGFDVAVFDMDGVITKTARVHARAWKLMFDEFMQARTRTEDKPFREFTSADYLKYLDGKPRLKGIKSFLTARHMDVPAGEPTDGAGQPTMHGLARRKNELFRRIIDEDGAAVFPYAVALVEALRQAGVRVAVASSSLNCEFILQRAGALHLFEARVDGVVSAERGLSGKPEGDIFVQAAAALGCRPGRGVVFEDAISGVQAGRNGGFGLVVGVARSDNVDELNRHGADVTVTSLSAMSVDWLTRWFERRPLHMLDVWDRVAVIRAAYDSFQSDAHITLNPRLLRAPRQTFVTARNIIIFLDFDGTISEIAPRPEQAVLLPKLRPLFEELSWRHTIAVVSGRQREDVEQLVGVEGIFYAGSHGFDIRRQAMHMVQPKAKAALPLIKTICAQLTRELADIPGVVLEDKKYSVAVHYRLVDETRLPDIRRIVERVMAGQQDTVRLLEGKKVFELLPALDWNKGRAVRWIMNALKLSFEQTLAIYIGDDTTDEDAFAVLRGRGVGILVAEEPRPTAAEFYVRTPTEVATLFARIVAMEEEREQERQL